VLDEWRQVYGGNLLIALPDAFGTTSFLRHAPDWVADWTGFRPDSARRSRPARRSSPGGAPRGRDPREKLLVFSDGLDVDAIERDYHHFDGKVRMAFGWGTDLTNDFIGCLPTARVRSIRCRWSARSRRPTASRRQTLRQSRQGLRGRGCGGALSKGFRSGLGSRRVLQSRSGDARHGCVAEEL
jgi:hypothetical protein